MEDRAPRRERLRKPLLDGSVALVARALRAPRNVLGRLSATRLRLHERAERRREACSRLCLNRSENRARPQGGKYEILEEVFRRIGTTSRFCVEIGCDDGNHCNSRRLIEADGWSGILLDENPHDCRFAAERFGAYPVEVIHSPMRVDTVDPLLEAKKTPPQVDFLSVYIEGNDYWHTVATVPLDDILRELATVRCLKIGAGTFRIEQLARALRNQGFFVDWLRTGPRIGLFFAC